MSKGPSFGLASLDLFGRTFLLRANKAQKTKNTAFGGCLTILIFGASLAYLGYLLQVFFQRLNPPTITVNKIVNQRKTSIDFDFPPISFSFSMPEGKTLSQYLSFKALMAPPNSYVYSVIDMVQCSEVNSAYSGGDGEDGESFYGPTDYCLQPDIASKITQFEAQDQSQYVYVMIKQCSQDDSPDCLLTGDPNADSDTLDELLYDESFFMWMDIMFLELDTQSGVLTDKTDTYDFIFDTYNRQFSQIEYQRYLTDIDTGILMRDWTNYTYVGSYSIFSTFMTSTFIADYFSDPVFGSAMLMLRLSLSRTDISSQVVFEKIGSPIAQFASILNVLMLVGIIASLLSDARIFENFVDVYLRYQYSSTAAQILDEKQGGGGVSSSRGTNNLAKVASSPISPKVQNATVIANSSERLSDTLQGRQKYLMDDEDELIELSNVQSMGLYYTAKSRAELLRQGKKEEALKDLTREERIYTILFDRTSSSSTYQNLIKRLIVLENAVQFTFTPEQYAALKYIGRDLDKVISGEGQLNHLETLDRVDQEASYRETLVEEFLKRGRNGQLKNDLDKRIFEALIPQVSNNTPSTNQQNGAPKIEDELRDLAINELELDQQQRKK